MTLKHIFARVTCEVLVPWVEIGYSRLKLFVNVVRSSGLFFDIDGYSCPKFFGMVG